MISRFRDLSIVNFGSVNMVVANDSSGAIGLKENDMLKVDPEIVGYHGAQVALMEVIAYGADPILLINNLMVEMNPTGKRIINGIYRAMKSVGMNPDISINGSTEENFATTQTGMGITVIGKTTNKSIPIHRSEKRDLVVALGKPLVGDEVINASDEEKMDSEKLLKIRALPFIKELLPVGSSGIIHELRKIEKDSGFNAIRFKTDLNLEASGGPSTCVLATLRNEHINTLIEIINIKVTPLSILV